MNEIFLIFSWILGGVYVLTIAVSFWFFAGFCRAMRREIPEWHPENAVSNVQEKRENVPFCAVILSLRGSDPKLADCIEGLCRQDYARFQLLVILDSPGDPARKVVESVLARHPEINAEVRILQNPPETCSLKCAAIAQTVRTLTPECAFVAFLDGDVIPYPSWLRNLLAPFQDSSVDFCTGYRWFVPEKGGVGTLVRYVWNAASCVHVYLNGVIWGGSSAIRCTALKKCNFISRWENTISEDITASRVAVKNHCKVAFVPQIIMANHEECSLMFAYRWCARQTFFIRIYYPEMWFRMLVIAFLLTFLHAASFGIFAYAYAVGDAFLQAVTLGGLLFFWLSSLIFAPILECTARYCIARNQPPVKWKFSFPVLKITLALPFTLAVFTLGLLRARFIRNILWRGISYRIFPDKTIRRMNYEPFSQPEIQEENQKNVSIE